MFNFYGVFNNPVFLGILMVLLPVISYITERSPFEVGILMTECVIFISLIGGICISILTKSKDDTSHLNIVVGLSVVVGGLFMCFMGWLGLIIFSFGRSIGSSFADNFFN